MTACKNGGIVSIKSRILGYVSVSGTHSPTLLSTLLIANPSDDSEFNQHLQTRHKRISYKHNNCRL